MGVRDEMVDLERVACEVCLKEIPKADATVPETEDVVYFCGLDCYTKWKAQEGMERGGKAD